MEEKFKLNGPCRGLCAKGCGRQNKQLNTYDYLADIPGNAEATDLVEVQFKNTRKGYYHNSNRLPLEKGDIVAVEAALGHDIGIVSLTGELVREQMRLKKIDLERNPLRKIYRKAKPHDIEKWQQAIALEHDTMIRSRVIAADLGLDMKIGTWSTKGTRQKPSFTTLPMTAWISGS